MSEIGAFYDTNPDIPLQTVWRLSADGPDTRVRLRDVQPGDLVRFEGERRTFRIVTRPYPMSLPPAQGRPATLQDIMAGLFTWCVKAEAVWEGEGKASP